MSRYIEWDSVKLKLRLNDDTLKDEIGLYIQEVDDLVNNRLRNKLGSVDANGDPIDLPLTIDGEPPIDEELKAIATDAVIGKFRLQNSEKPLIWDTAIKNLDNYLDRRFGYTRDILFTQKTVATVTPTSGTRGVELTLTGENWGQNTELTFQFEGIDVDTQPSFVVTDNEGRFTDVTFLVPSNATQEQTSIINITDGERNSKQLKFTVLPFLLDFSMDGVIA